ncbi:hypothetical protein NW762_004342 [Fusarium torreyae]|uniref:Uncharacterized protein n=1 Tax=Fusarium torreyae TaxID=1237075 RepID=A0A9W8VGT1_9HYPO|nr:hypothetical protein NW762_004342 [Fusarium torreyae]
MSSLNHLDRLPDELLLNILRHALTQEKEIPLWVDQCLQLPRHQYPRSKTGWDSLPPGIAPVVGSWSYSITEVDEYLTAAVEPSQHVHRHDWLMVNSTCRRTRRIGKEVFFSTRSFVVSLAMHEKLQSGKSWLDLSAEAQSHAWELHRAETFVSLTARRSRVDSGFSHLDDLIEKDPSGWRRRCALSVEDQALALSTIRHVVFSDTYRTSASRMVSLPKLLGVFSRVQQCILLIGDWPVEGYIVEYELHMGDKESEDEACRTAAELEELLKNVGMDINIELGFGLVKDGGWQGWEAHQNRLENTLYPLLRFKARTLKQGLGVTGDIRRNIN